MATASSSDRARRLHELIAGGENELIERVLAYARRQEYTRYTSTLAEAWRGSVAGLSKPILHALEVADDVPELYPDEDYSHDPIAAFGILEAQRHRARGIDLAMFLGLMKYYRQGYADLVRAARLEPDVESWALLYVHRAFDRVELGYCTEWASKSTSAQVDELQAANRRLANEKNKFLTLFSSLGPPILLLDREDRITDMNFAAERLFLGSQRPGETYYGTPVRRLLPSPLAEAVESFHLDGRPQLRTAVTLGESAVRQDFDVHLHRMLDVSGKFDGVTLVLHDVTESLRMARELRDAHAVLEKRVAERTTELRRALESLHAEVREQERVAAGQRRLEVRVRAVQRLESLGVLAGGMAHDFNNLLTTMLGNTELVAQGLSPGSADAERLRHVEVAGRHAADLCRQMLAYAGRAPVEVRVIDLVPLVNGTAELARSSIPRSIGVTCRFADELCVRGDAAQLRQVVLGLIVNAAEAIGEREGAIALVLERARCTCAELEATVIGLNLPAGEYAVLGVTDDGCGMDQPTCARVFDPFFTTKTLGRGLGLAAVLGIVRGHAGTIGIRSAPGAGTTVRVLLPLAADVAKRGRPALRPRVEPRPRA